MTNFRTEIPVLNASVLLARCGYTGEDGFEISCEPNDAEKLYSLLLSNPEVKPAGLGSRDSLRIEAGLCLHGNDQDDTRTPAECTMMWTVRKPPTNQVVDFIGRKALSEQIKAGV